MQNTEWSGRAGANHGNVCIAHNDVIVTLNNQPSTFSRASDAKTI